MEKIHENNSLLYKPEFSSATKTSFLTKSTSDWWEYTKYCFKENAKTLSKISTTQENITVSRKNLIFY